MPESKDIKPFRVERDLHACPSCGYQLGFHVSFLHAAAGSGSPSLKSTRDMYRTILVCPECGARYDVGWKVSLHE